MVESDYEQDVQDIAQPTCVDPTSTWEGFEVPVLEGEEHRSESDVDSMNSTELESLEGTDDDEEVPYKKWKKIINQDFNPEVDMNNPVFRIGMLFSTASIFRDAVKAHAVKNRRAMKFDFNDKNKIKASCKSPDCQWIVFASWLNTDFKTFKVKTLEPDHTCAMTFRNMFLSSEMIEKKYLNQWRVNTEWNFDGFAQQLRMDTNIDATQCQYYRPGRLLGR